MPKPKNTGFPKPAPKKAPVANTPPKGKYKALPAGPTKPMPKNTGVVKGKPVKKIQGNFMKKGM
jgi:hypothetical protein